MASRDRPPAPPKRRPLEAQRLANVVTYKRRRAATRSPDPGATCANMMTRSANSRHDGHQMLARHWISWRDTLEGFLQSPGVNQGGGIQSCILDALRYNRCQSVQQGNFDKGQGASDEHPSGVADAKEIGASVALKDAIAESLDANRAMCNNALLDIFVSEKFASLCDLLAGTLRVNNLGKVIDLEKLDANMRNGNYAQNPALFDNDVQQIWEKFEQVGQEMTGLSSNLSIISRASYQKQASGVSEVEIAEHRTEETSLVDVIHKVPKNSTTTMQLTPCDSSHSTIPKRTEASGPYRICTCQQCGTKAEEEKSLICDECDTMYHFDCVKRLNPAMKQIPATWHCSACSNKGKESAADTMNNVHHNSLHSDCPLCDKLDLVKLIEHPEVASGIELADERIELADERIELVDEREGSSVSNMEEDNEPEDLSRTALSNLCKHCGTCEDDDKRFLVCAHPYCRFKFYHIRCLKTSQIACGQQKKPRCWYCPSCLCRGCLKNKDDEDIVLCDGCDEAYHIYCMIPKRISVPKGQWQCPSCSMRRARQGMQKYEQSILNRHKNVKHASNANQLNALLGDGPEK